MVKATDSRKNEIGAPLYVILAMVLLGGGLFWFLRYTAQKPQPIELSAEAKQYVRNLKLSDVAIKATESYVKQTIVEIEGKITNSGGRPLDTVEIYCVFHDPYGQLVLRERVPVVGARAGGLKPGQTKSFRLPFDNIPESWNRQLPQLVIAGIKFST